MKVLISGFEPFDQMSFNPSQELMRRLLQESFSFDLETIVLPVSFEKCFSVLGSKIKSFQPDVIIGTGLANSRSEVTIERVAINTIEARIADNDGVQPQLKAIIDGASDGIFSQLPIHAMVENAKKEHLPAGLSNSAGTYVCNYLMYMIVHYAKNHHLRGGFIHLPPSKEISEQGLEMSLIVKTVAKMLRAIEGPENVDINLGSEE